MSQTPGFKQGKAASTKDRIKELEVGLDNSQQALNITQMMLKQVMQQLDALRKDTTNSLNMCNDIQYRTLAMINLSDIDIDKLDEEGDKLKLKDYNEASDKEDAEKNYTVGDVVKDESIVILTSKTETESDQGIFRSKIAVAQLPFEEMKKDIIGKKTGDKFVADLNGISHNMEIIGIRELPVELTITEEVEEVKEECCDKDCENCKKSE